MNDHTYPDANDAVAFPILTDSELAVLAALGTGRPVAEGEYLYRAGDITYDFYVILSGVVEVVVHADGEERIINRRGAGRFLGELNLLTGERVYLSARVARPGEELSVRKQGGKGLPGKLCQRDGEGRKDCIMVIISVIF